MRVSFCRLDGPKGGDGGSVTTIERSDGVSLRMRSYDRTFSVPHDLAHFVAEHEFRLNRGVWGSIAAGAMFASMTVVDGRLRHDSRQRSRELMRANQREIRLAEIVAGAVHDAVERGAPPSAADIASAWQIYRTDVPPFPADLPARAAARLNVLRAVWQALGPDESIDLTWQLPATSPRIRSAR
ncbi:hypothetical protein Ga0074812_10997 [Parafrankia irregularis]|uniref:Uncharacterized protein n=1 Tax=Parafrankia irregularis TaxID=795642 RepID=A0A0S4QN48_9ACTN|nr:MULTISPECIES: hypothetical protein [Parafrankia]MBE3200545.1 hypothetical protein [Parafrankia sp. CH37]CUU56877.1 hypothetical protein Ga0074812_10997 [Parafrankia irregularis]